MTNILNLYGGNNMQKFKKGDLVKIAKDLGSSMSHFTNDCEAIVMGSYADKFGGPDTKSYTLFLENGGECAWYEEHQLTLIESDRMDLLDKWENEQKAERELKSNLDWIFENGKEVSKNPHGASIEALASCFGLTNLWGPNGEGFEYYNNAINTMGIANSFLISGDKDGWLKFADELKRR